MSWDNFLNEEKSKAYYSELMSFVDSEYAANTCYPPKENIFRAFELTQPEDIKAVILGQDPYHNVNQAHGLCFSVLPTQPKLPPSLRNIYKELESEYGVLTRSNGCLEDWAGQGVLMLNTVMSVREHSANSHKGKGWEVFTDNVISYVNSLPQPIVFFLWGAPAQKKESLLTNPNHLVIKAVHPSPLSAYRGFFGCNHFKLCNEFLTSHGCKEIIWQ